ncbi:MAG: FAD-dependent oxidoreductase [Bacteroidota bacterium]
MPILDLQADRDISQIKTKVCIIGSGPAGASLALELAKSGSDVAILEKGNIEPDTKMPALDGDTDKKFGSELNWSSQLGGSSNVWAGRLGELQSIDFEKRQWVPESGWPISYSEISPYYKQAKRIINMPDKYPEAENLFSGFREFETKRLIKTRSPFNFRPHLLKSALNNSNLRIFINANVTRLEFGELGGQIIAAKIKRPDKSVVQVSSDIFVLATGGIYTPRLLLNSNDKHYGGIGNQFDNVGRYLSTHPKGEVAILNLNKAVSTKNAIFGKYQNGLGLEASVQTQMKVLNCSFDLVPLYPFKINEATERLLQKHYLDSPFIDKRRYLIPFTGGLLHLLKEQTRRVFNMPRFSRTFMLTGHFDQYPNRENQIFLSISKLTFYQRQKKSSILSISLYHFHRFAHSA